MRVFDIVDVNASNVARTGFFCAMSKRDGESWRRKLEWVQARFGEGLRIKMVMRGNRGFIEYIPGEYAWRAIEARGYMVVHCLWVVGRAKKQGCGAALLDECVREARAKGMHGVAAVSARAVTGLTPTPFFVKQGFRIVATTPNGLDLVALKFHRAANPRFSGDWERKAEALGPGVQVVYSAQCPYAFEGVQNLEATGPGRDITVRAVEMTSAEQVRKEAPSAYGTFAICSGGQVVAHLFHCMRGERLARLVGMPV